MDIKVARKPDKLQPGQTVFLRVFGSEPFVLIQPADDLLVKSLLPETSKKETSWNQETYIIHDSWIVRNKKGNYIKFPTAALTAEKPVTKSDNVFTGMLIASCIGLVTAPMWLMEVMRLF